MLIEIEKNITWLSMLTKEEREYEIFKLYMNDPEFAEMVLTFARGKIKGIGKQIIFSRTICDSRNTMIEKNQETKKEILTHYKKVLENIKKVALELKLDNTLELCNLYTYLLWNGYFSKEKKLTYKAEDRINIYSSYSSDIMNGYGVCLNFSDMLTDFINEFDYSSATLVNYMDKSCKIDKSSIKRNKVDPKESTKFMNALISSITKKTGNHAFNLINENGKLYIYDSTNISISKIINKEKVNLITGTGEILLKPYFSYILNTNDKSVETLDLLHTSKEIISPYTRSEFIIEWQFCMELFQNKKNILDDFYDEIINNILKITEVTNDVQKIKKR